MFNNFFRIFHILVGIVLLLILIFDLFSTPSIPNFLSYFTIQTNILSALVFLYVGINKDKKPVKDLLRGGITTYMIITGIAYALLLEKTQGQLDYPWINLVYHKIMPALVTISWIFFPVKLHLRYKQAFLWLVFPLIYGVYTLIRGLLVNWYPYDFVNPIKIGYGAVFLNFAVFCFMLFITSILLIFFTKTLKEFFKT